MSHFTQCKTLLRDEDCLVEALGLLGFRHVERHAVAQHLHGYQGDERAQTAEIIIRRQWVGAGSNDLGFKRSEDGTYVAIISEFDRHQYNETWLQQLSRNYARLVVLKKAAELGWIKEEERVLASGEIELVYVEPV